eukprot:3835254-Prymnesium_polylepis.1
MSSFTIEDILEEAAMSRASRDVMVLNTDVSAVLDAVNSPDGRRPSGPCRPRAIQRSPVNSTDGRRPSGPCRPRAIQRSRDLSPNCLVRRTALALPPGVTPSFAWLGPSTGACTEWLSPEWWTTRHLSARSCNSVAASVSVAPGLSSDSTHFRCSFISPSLYT